VLAWHSQSIPGVPSDDAAEHAVADGRTFRSLRSLVRPPLNGGFVGQLKADHGRTQIALEYVVLRCRGVASVGSAVAAAANAGVAIVRFADASVPSAVLVERVGRGGRA
jgi:hypothetical protein